MNRGAVDRLAAVSRVTPSYMKVKFYNLGPQKCLTMASKHIAKKYVIFFYALVTRILFARQKGTGDVP